MKKIWGKEEIDYLNKEFGKISLSKIAKTLNRSLASVKKKSIRLGLRVKNKMLADFYYSER